jgi:hypothetical protein
LMLIASLGLIAGLFLVAALVGPTASLAAGPPPTETPPGLSKAPSTFPLNLTGQSATRPAKTIQLHLGSLAVPSRSVRPALLARNGSGWQKIMAEDFEGTFPLPEWTLLDTSSTDGGEYHWGQRNCRALSGSYSLWAGGGGADGGSLACGETYVNNLFTWLVYGPFDLTQATDAELQFTLWSDVEGNEQGPILIDVVFWGASTNGNSFSGHSTSGQTGDWIPENLDLTDAASLGDLTGEPEVYVAWLLDANESNPTVYEGAFVDDAALWVYTDPPPTPPPPTPTLPITRHTTLADFASGRSHDNTIVEAEQGDGALTLAAQVNALGNWQRLPSLPGALSDFAAVTAKGHLFVIGGNAPGGQYQKKVYSAMIQDDGLLGHWVEATELPQALMGHTAVVAHDHLFLLGGFNTNGFQATVFSARINEDGTLGEWTALPALPEPLAVNASVSAHGYIYVLGGRKFNSPLTVSDKIHRAKVNADGTLGEWETLPTALPRSSMWHEAVATCDHLYLIAGQDATINEYSGVYQAEIQPDGSLGTWNETAALPKTLAAHAAAAVGGGILVTGGWSSPDPLFAPQRSVYWAPLDPDCTLGDWVELTPLPYRTYKHALVATDHYIYNLGGGSIASRTFASVLMAPLQLDDSSVRQGIFNHQFYLGDNYTIDTLRWTEEGSGDTEISLRYRVGNAGTGEYGPWSDYASTNPVAVNATGGYLEYQFKFAGGSGLSDKLVTEISLSIAAAPATNTYLPIVLKR